jgi:TolA-binding protein
MAISQTIIEELRRYNKINNYILEQEAGLPPVPPAPGEEPLAAAVPPPPAPGADAGTTPPESTEPEPIDIANDPDVEKVGDEGSEETGTEELEITDLVKSQQNIETKQEEYFNNLFSQLSSLENKLSDMEGIFTKLNDIEAKIEKYREKTPQEKLELRSIDSGPFNQKLSDFFVDKEQDMEKSGKNEYVLTTDEVEDFTPSEIKGTFNDFGDESQYKPLKF